MYPAEKGVVVHTKAQLVTDGPLSRPVPVALRYDAPAGAEPATVRFCFPGGTEWSVPRSLLESGLRTPARGGDIGIWPCGRVQAIVEFHSSDGVAVVQFDSSALLRFLRRTYSATASSVTR
ncbi:SsgA family sporulation/cell division regulator [Streptomyces ficellus]|uniref:SsgA family sporulation/cell division regulator n=1 Tax=Streptomyces ficellus TaxID=1977088 RepID=A0ABT7Z0P5_9ACTN|nr:SsgA family sporulation/cell division regulator [Streptomyces ficellus]MDN3293064.1 SsgA family sporulation/cell division regulator [Streptomyces ficellus]